MKYLLKKDEQDEGVLCDKVTIDEFDYYVSDEQAKEGFYGYIDFQGGDVKKVGKHFADDWKKVIATNDTNIDLPKVVDEVEKFIKKTFYKEDGINFKRSTIGADDLINGFKIGYNKSQETHPNSDEDMIEFGEWCKINYSYNQKSKYWYKYADKTDDIRPYTTKELLQLWKEQQPKIIYYHE